MQYQAQRTGLKGQLMALMAGFVLLVLQPTRADALLSRLCNLDGAHSGTTAMTIHALGRRDDMVADFIFDDPKGNAHLQQPGYLVLDLPAGDPVTLNVLTDANLVIELRGAKERVRAVNGVRAAQGIHLGLIGADRNKVHFSVAGACGVFAPWGLAGKDKAKIDAAEHKVMRFEWKRQPPCRGLDCFATPITWPRQIPVPDVISVDLDAMVASAPARRPDLLPGWAGIVQLMASGALRRPVPGEAEAALEAVRTKYVSRFTPDWKPGFEIDLVMTRNTPLPKTDSHFGQLTILVPDDIVIDRQWDHCLVAMGRLKPRSGYELELTKLRQPPPYVITPRLGQKCLGEDQNPGPNRFNMSDRNSPHPDPECLAAEAKPDEVVVAVYDAQVRYGQSFPLNKEEPIAHVRLTGTSKVVLVARSTEIPRRWRIEEAYPGQVTSFVLAEQYYIQWAPKIEGLRPEQVVLDKPRLSDWQRTAAPDDVAPRQPYRTAMLRNCASVNLTSWGGPHRTASIGERGLDHAVKIFTGRQIDIFRYIMNEEPVTIDVGAR